MVIARAEQRLCGCYKGQQEFHKVLDLEDEGLVIYCHSLCREAKVTQGGVVGSKAHATQDVCVILHNTKDVKLKPADIIPALEKKDISCPRCRLLFEHAQNLLRNVKSIDKQNVTGVCDHCLKKAQSKKQCELCEQAVRKYLTMRDVKREEMKRYIKLWLSKMKHIVKDAVAEKSRKDKPRAYSDLQINELCQLSPRATRQLEVKQMFPSELRKSDSNLNANLLDLADDEKQMKKAVVFDESMEPLILAPYQTGVIDAYRHDKSDITVAGSDSVTQIKPVKPIKPIIHEIPKVAPWEQETHKVDDDISVIKEVTVKLKREPSSKVVTPHDSSGISVKATSSTHVKVTPKKRHLTPESDSEKHDIATPELGEPKRKKIKVSEEKESTTHIKATKRKRVTEGEAEHPYSEQYKQEKDEYSKMKKKARESEALPKTLKRLEDSHLTDDEVKLQQKIPKLSHETEKPEKELEKKTTVKSKKPKIEQDTVENILQKQFSYFFPKSMEKQAKKPPKIGAPSSQLIRATHEKIRQQAEEEKKRHEQERQKKLEEKEKKRLEKEEKKRLAEEQKKEAQEQKKEAREQQKEAREQKRHGETQKQAVPDAERKIRVAEEGDLTKKDLAKELLKSRVTSKSESKTKTSVKDRSEESEKPIKDLKPEPKRKPDTKDKVGEVDKAQKDKTKPEPGVKSGLKDKDQETEKVKIESRIKAEPKSKTDIKDKGELIDKAKKDGKVKSERVEETESAKREVRGKATSREEFESGKREPRGRAASREETESGRRGRAASKDETESGKREPRGRAASKDETESRKREPRGKTASREEIESGKREPRRRAASKDEKESPKREPRGKAAPREETESGKRELRGRAASREETESGKRERRGRAASKDETESPKRERRGRAASKDETESPKRERRGRAASKDETESPIREPRGRAASREETESGKRDKSGLKEKEKSESSKDLRTKQQKDKIDKSPEKSPRSKSDMKDKDVEKSQKEKGKQDREVKEAVPKKKRDSKADAEASDKIKEKPIDFAKMKLEKGDLSEHAASIKTAPKDKSKDVSAKVADTRKTAEVSKGKTKEVSKDKGPSSKEAASKEKPLDFKGMQLDKGELSQPAVSVKDKSKDVSVKASDKPKAKDGSKDKSKEVSKGLSLKSKEKSLDFKGMKLDTGAGLVPPVSMGAGIKEKPKDITVKPPDLPPKESTKKEEKQPVKKDEKASKGQQEKIPKGKEETKEEKSKKSKEDPEEALFRKLQAERLKEKEEEKKLLKKEEAEAQKARALAEKKAKEAAEKATTKIREAKATPRPEPPRPPPKPKLEPKRVDEPAIEVKMNQVKVYNSSADDLILRLVKIKQTALQLKCRERPYKIDPSRIKAHRSRHEIGSVDISTCELCKNSDLEIDVDSYENNANIPSDMEIIIGEKIYKYKAPILELGLEDENEIIPILFKSSFEVEPLLTPQSMPAKHEIVEEPQKKSKESKGVDPDQGKGIIRYALSDRTFIDKGWTMLPTEKVVRKMNVYRMRPAHPEFDWFEHNKNKRLMTYDTGERLAEFDDNGRGRWYYRNGRLALDYYDAEETNAQQRFVIYSSGEPDERGRSHPITILATFDYLGNGIVFDHAGKIRLKYNQTEGVVLDRGIGPVSHWKWHTLNDPPVLQQVMIDTQMAHKDPQIIKLGSAADNKIRPDNEEMLAIEFDNFIKEKSKKLSQKFKPFQIKMKALKINEHFSLKVLDQATVYLIFRDGSTNLKLNIGMILDHQEIVDTDTAEVGEVSNNLERFPARTDSLAGLQRSVAYAQRYERTRTERERRLRPPEPCGSADQLIAAASAPLRIPLRTVPTGTTSSVANCRCRKPTNNLYYNTRLL